MESASRLQYDVILYAPLGRPPMAFGIVVYSSDHSQLHFGVQNVTVEDFGDDYELLADTSVLFTEIILHLGASKFIKWMEDTLSNTLRIEGPFTVPGTDAAVALKQLLREYDIHPVESDCAEH